ncbi:hypothetical protein [Kitasatospora viridis]|uniref:ADP-ribose pyrophosphatase YjhB (NUDIX family) n=1 Tax=Kitasatospora viridis TaxID=281105 RepID=A0A561T6W7_9ACTN|nr:hypothetical protein [Kitasatospora viridis]TWF82866.1 hypothetical protein FHX73_14348 [Kitasatospora viridis]
MTPPRRIGAQAVLVHPASDRVLLLDIAHRPCGWLPGRSCMPHEPPATALRDAVRRQLGIDLPLSGADLAAVDHTPGGRTATESYHFVFVHRLTPADAGLARPQERVPGLLGFEWVSPADLDAACRAYHVRRITHAVRAALGRAAPAMLTADQEC